MSQRDTAEEDSTRTDIATVAIGCNVGHRGQALSLIRDLLQRDGVSIDRASSEILTRPLGVVAQADFHNQVLRLRAPAEWSAQRWLDHTERAEYDAGRRPTYHWGPRRADVDILLLGSDGSINVDSDALTVPHPEIANRPFVQRLLREITHTEVA